MLPSLQKIADLSRRTIRQDPPLIHDDHPVGRMIDIFKPVFRDQYGRSQLQVYLANSVEKVRRRNGIQLAGRLIQDQYVRLHGHNGC